MSDDQSPARLFAALIFALAAMLGAALYATSREASYNAAAETRAAFRAPR